MIKRYGPAIVAVLFALLTAAAAALGDGHISQVEGVQLAIQGTTVAAVWLTPTAPAWLHTKTWAAMLLAVLNLLATVVTGGIDWGEGINLALAGLGVVAVRLVPPPDPAVVRVPFQSQRLT